MGGGFCRRRGRESKNIPPGRLPSGGRALRVLDVGTGTGFFPIVLAEMGHLPQGIDLTPAMLQEARAAAAQRGLCIPFFGI